MKMRVWKQWMATILTVCLAATWLPPAAMGAESRQRGQIFVGESTGQSETKTSVKVTLEYQYSPTGGMAGVNAHAPETVEFFLNEDGGTTPAAWPIPYYDGDGGNEYHDHDHDNLEGFRVVLDAAPLNAFLRKPPTGNEDEQELAEKLNRGDFDPDPEKMADEAAVTRAWIDARAFTTESGLSFRMVNQDGSAAVGSAALDGPRLILTNPERLEELGGRQEVTLKVNYRRDNGTYTVKHWVPKEGVLVPDVGEADHWRVWETESLSGRIGAMTRAEAQFIQGYANRAISQQPIKADGTTEVNIYYTRDNTIRVIFDTSEATSGEIPRQALNITDEEEDTIDLSAISPGERNAPVRPGYVFAGWAFPDKDRDGAMVPVTSLDAGLYDPDTQILTPDEAFLNRAQLQVSQETAGVNVLRFYPIWEVGATEVRVVFWTEDLTGTDDVDCREKDRPGELAVQTHYFDEEGAAYSNMGYMELEGVRTGSKLELDLRDDTLRYTDEAGRPAALDLTSELAKLPTMAIETAYQGTDPQWRMTNSAPFYTLDGCMITQKDGAPRETREGDTAAPNGTTVVNIYFVRNIYRLEFIYGEVIDDIPHLANGTLGYAKGMTGDGNGNHLSAVADGHEGETPKPVVVTAKYGADLRNDWPFHPNLHIETVASFEDQWWRGNTFFFVSWTTTAGPYNANAMRSGGTGEPTLMGVYGSMSADIIRDPVKHIQAEDGYDEESGTHRLYAYWSEYYKNNYFRYNHCYEVPEVTPELLLAQDGLVTLVLDGQDADDPRNACYLLPTEREGEVLRRIERYGFEDLKKVSYTPGQDMASIQIDDENGTYYGLRVYGGKCYALARLVSVVSTNRVGKQNPSARLHMERVNMTPDHSTLQKDDDGNVSLTYAVGTAEAPYQLFFYYDRVPYKITYNVGSGTGLKVLGTKQLYYGAKLSDFYNIALESGVSADGKENERGRTNGDYAVSPDNPNGWTLPTAEDQAGDAAMEGTQPVCPDRNEKGTSAWKFKGWAMDLAGTALLDSPDDWDDIVSGDLQLYAQWEVPKYTVEFDWNGGHLAFGSEEDYKVQEISANSTVAGAGLAPVPLRPGYYLDHWRVTHYKLEAEDDWTRVKAEDYGFLFDQRISVSMRI